MRRWVGGLLLGLLLAVGLSVPVAGQPFSAQIIRALQTFGLITNGCTDGQFVEWDTPTGKYRCVAAPGGGAATTNTYITQTAAADLSAEQALSALSSGIMRVATTTGIVTSLGDDLPLANLVQASAISVLAGRGAAAGAGDFQEITLGGGLTMTGTALSTSSPGLTAVRVYTANDTWTKPANLHSVVMWVVGGGGGGGGAATTAGTQCAAGGGGGGGGASMKQVVAASLGATETVTIGAAGAAGAAGANNGGAGGTTSFGAHASSTGGGGGDGGGAAAPNLGADGGAGGVGSSGDANLNGSGAGPGLHGVAASRAFGGNGGSSIFGGGSRSAANSAGQAGGNYGGGGSGASNAQSETQEAGGAGAAGLVIVYEYSN